MEAPVTNVSSYDSRRTEFERDDERLAPLTADRPNRITRRGVLWGAIAASVTLTIVIQVLFSLLGAGIGLGAVNVTDPASHASNFGIGAGIWWVVTSCISLFIGGLAAAWLSGVSRRFDGMLHGLVAASVALLLTIWLLTSAVGGLLGGGFSLIGNLASMGGGGIASAAKPLADAAGLSPDMLQQQARAYMQPANPDPAAMSPQDAQKAIASNLVTYARGGADAQGAKDQIIAIMAAQMKISRDEATKRFNDGQAKFDQAKQETVQKAEAAANASAAAASQSSLALCVLLVLGAIAAALGGAAGTRRTGRQDDVPDRRSA